MITTSTIDYDILETNFPKAVLKVIDECAKKYPNDIYEATLEAMERIEKLEEFDEDLINKQRFHSTMRLIHNSRSKMNKRLRRNINQPKTVLTKPKTKSVSSSVIKRIKKDAMEQYYNYAINGRGWGTIRGEELPALIADKKNLANGTRKLINLLIKTEKYGIPKNKTVREVIPPNVIVKMFRDTVGDPIHWG